MKTMDACLEPSSTEGTLVYYQIEFGVLFPSVQLKRYRNNPTVLSPLIKRIVFVQRPVRQYVLRVLN